MSDEFREGMEELSEPSPENVEAPVEVATPEEVAAPAAVESEPLWKRAGFDDEASWESEVTNLAGWRAKLQRQSSDLGRKAKEGVSEEIEAPQPIMAVDDDDPLAEYDPVQSAAIRRAAQIEAQRIVSEAIGPLVEVSKSTYNQTAQQKFDTFAQSVGADPADLFAVMQENNGFFMPRDPTLSDMDFKLEAAYALLNARNTDPEAQRAAIRSEEVRKLQDTGAEIVAVTPGKAPAVNPETDTYDNIGDFRGMLAEASTGD